MSALSDSQKLPRGRRARRAVNPRKKRVNLSFNGTEYQLLVMAAERHSLAPGAYAARVALAVAKGELVPLPTSERERLQELQAARVSANRIGNNLNQIARALNAESEVTPQQLAAVLERVEQAVERLDDATVALLESR